MASPVATIRIYEFTGAGPTATNVDSEDGTDMVFGRADAVDASSGRIPAPTATGTNYSWHKTIGLYCVSDGAGGTEILNKEFSIDGAPTTGLYMFYKNVADTYTQASSGNLIADSTASNGAVPSGYAACPTSATGYDSAADAAADTTKMGDYLQLVVGIGSNYAGGASNGVTLSDLVFAYDEQEA